MGSLGIILFDSIGPGKALCYCDGVSKYHPIFNEIPRYSSTKDGLVDDQPNDYSLRSAFMRQLRTPTFIHDVLEDNSMLIWFLVKVIAAEWLDVVRIMEVEVESEDEDFHLLDDDNSEL